MTTRHLPVSLSCPFVIYLNKTDLPLSSCHIRNVVAVIDEKRRLDVGRVFLVKLDAHLPQYRRLHARNEGGKGD